VLYSQYITGSTKVITRSVYENSTKVGHFCAKRLFPPLVASDQTVRALYGK